MQLFPPEKRSRRKSPKSDERVEYWFGPYKRSCVYQDVELLLRYMARGYAAILICARDVMLWMEAQHHLLATHARRALHELLRSPRQSRGRLRARHLLIPGDP